jgi:hypothetical protein
MPPPETGIRVRVVGRDGDGKVYVITSTGHLRPVERWDFPTLVDIFAPMSNTLKFCWPAWGKAIEVEDPDTGEVKKVVPVKRAERDPVIECLINEAARLPDFDPHLQHRGRGGWQDAQGAFVWHSGGWLWRSASGKLERSRPAMHEGYLYTRQAATIEPWQTPVSAEESPARRILEDLRTWNWQRPYLDPILVLGWIATALMGGALPYRPIIFATGGAGVGKSRLHELVRSSLDGAVITSVNTTAAGIYQRVKQDALPFMVDELESKAGSTRAESVIELARVAYSGGDISRGGADHEATTFTARNSFFFSAIIPPPMGAQDKSRMALLNLGPLERAGHSGRDLTLKPETDGRMMLRQVMDGWKDFRDRLLPNYAEALGAEGLSARAIDTFGTLLAAAELLVGPGALEEIGLPVTEHKQLGEIVAAATSADRSGDAGALACLPRHPDAVDDRRISRRREADDRRRLRTHADAAERHALGRPRRQRAPRAGRSEGRRPRQGRRPARAWPMPGGAGRRAAAAPDLRRDRFSQGRMVAGAETGAGGDLPAGQEGEDQRLDQALRAGRPRGVRPGDAVIAALFVQTAGVYFGLPHVDPWDRARDAQLYSGPHPLVAHPPCERWGRYWGGAPTTWPRKKKGDDGGCFAFALAAVRRWGGILEHPEASAAWPAFRLLAPPREGGWIRADWIDGHHGWTCCVEQGAYGHRARKATWLYAHGVDLPELKWGPAEGDFVRLDDGFHSAQSRARAVKTGACQRLSKKQRAATPIPFRDLLISIALTAQSE